VFILGAALSKSFAGQRDLQRKLRVIAFGIVTPFFFLKGGMNVSISALATSVGLVAILFALKIAAKFVGVYPFARRYLRGHAPYATLLMSTGLTFGTISALYGLQAGHIDKTQFTVLVTVVIATAVIPTLIAQRFFQPPLPLGAAQPSQAAPTGSVADEERAGPEAAGDQEHAGVGGSVGEQTS
jgi:Kef-type K+ transport system membrane component KefB